MSNPASFASSLYPSVLAAKDRVHPILPVTLCHAWPGLCEQLECDLFLKHENHQPVGAFKVRGGVNLVGQLDPGRFPNGILGVSTGNHGQSLAFAARQYGMRCRIVVPRRNNPDKVRAIRQLGAELLEIGEDFDEARLAAEDLASDPRTRYIHSANEPELIAGVGTYAWEVFQRVPNPDVLIVPIGLGSGICGTIVVRDQLSPQSKVIGVQAANAPSIFQSWKLGKIQPADSSNTWAEGLATRVPAELTFEIIRRGVDEMVLVSEEEMRQAAYLLLAETHNLAEGAGAASLAAAIKRKEQLRGKTVVAVLSGGNLDLQELPAIMAAGSPLHPTPPHVRSTHQVN